MLIYLGVSALTVSAATFLLLFFSEPSRLAVTPVSYTHLDVYKRQLDARITALEGIAK